MDSSLLPAPITSTAPDSALPSATESDTNSAEIAAESATDDASIGHGRKRTRAAKLTPPASPNNRSEDVGITVVAEDAAKGLVQDAQAQSDPETLPIQPTESNTDGGIVIHAQPRVWSAPRKLTPRERMALRKDARIRLRTIASETRGFKAELQFTLTTKVATAVYKNTYADVMERTNALVGGAIGGLGLDKGLTFLELLQKAFDVSEDQIAKMFAPIQADIAAAHSRTRKVTMTDASTPMLKTPVTVNNMWCKRYYDLLAQIDTCLSRLYLLQFDGLRDDLDVRQMEERLRKIPYALARSIGGLQAKLYGVRIAEQRAANERDRGEAAPRLTAQTDGEALMPADSSEAASDDEAPLAAAA